jgi:protein SCO1/2
MKPSIVGIIGFLICITLGCSSGLKEEVLPILGRRDVQERKVEDKIVYDTIYHTIQSFAFLDQDSSLITNADFQNKVYVADFFFTSCPSICPIMKTQMLRIYDEFEKDENVAFLSHSIDPRHDTVAVLREYAERLGVESDKWHFVTGEKETIYKLAQNSYMSVAAEDNEAEGGFIHSGRFLLVDKEGRIRGVYDGTDPIDVDELMDDIPVLLNEYK